MFRVWEELASCSYGRDTATIRWPRYGDSSMAEIRYWATGLAAMIEVDHHDKPTVADGLKMFDNNGFGTRVGMQQLDIAMLTAAQMPCRWLQLRLPTPKATDMVRSKIRQDVEINKFPMKVLKEIVYVSFGFVSAIPASLRYVQAAAREAPERAWDEN